MSTIPHRLPVELFHEILLNLRDDLSTLKKCALACSTLRYIVQQHLFSELTLHRFPHPQKNITANAPSSKNGITDEGTLCSWLLNPSHAHLLSHVRHLKLQCYPPPPGWRSVPDPAFPSVLDNIPAQNLSKITILRRYRDDPLSDTEVVVRGLLGRCTALEELNIEDRRVPASYLGACAGSVRVLRVHGTEFVEDRPDGCGGGGVVSTTTRWPKLEALVFPLRLLPECLLWMVMGITSEDGGRDVFPRLKHLFVGDEVKDVEIVNQVLDMCKPTLRTLVYTPYGYNFSSYPNPCYNQNGTVIEFTIPPSLRMLAINCPIMLKPASRTYPNPFGWLNHTFRKLSRQQPCSLEVVHIKFLTTGQIEMLDALFPNGFPIDLCFAEFDRLLSNKTRFPRLKKVYLTVGRHYLNLFADPETLPRLNERGLLGIIYEDVLKRRFWEFWTMKNVDNLPWDGKTYSFV